MNSTKSELLSNAPVEVGCSKDALTDVFGWFLQVLLACLAFTCLIGQLKDVYKLVKVIVLFVL